MPKKEYNLFIVWKNALYLQDKIIKDLKKKFKVRNLFYINWSSENYSRNLSRFYGTYLPDNSFKEEHCGKGEFLLIVVEDPNPKYEERITSHGKSIVNTNMFDCKMLYRKWSGGGHKIHATDSEVEFNHDITLLFDLNKDDFIKKYKPSSEIVKIEKDLFGAESWKSVDEMFYALNNCTKYALLRNWESLPDEIYVNEHNDIDLLCVSRDDAAYILNAAKAQDLDYRVQYYVKVADTIANFDLRYVGDNYYDKNLEERILDNRVYNKKGFYVLNDEDYFYTLLYHALIHKNEFKKDYKIRLSKMNEKFTPQIADDIQESVKFLEKWLFENKYLAYRPHDKTVMFNLDAVEYLKPYVYKDEDKLYSLMDENEMLKKKNDELINENNYYKEKIEQITNSRGWKYLEKLRKVKRKIKRKK